MSSPPHITNTPPSGVQILLILQIPHLVKQMNNQTYTFDPG